MRSTGWQESFVATAVLLGVHRVVVEEFLGPFATAEALVTLQALGAKNRSARAAVLASRMADVARDLSAMDLAP